MDTFMEEIDRRANLAFSNQMEMLTFFLTDSQQYGINVFKIIEVVEAPEKITKIPESHHAILGGFDFRGQMVTVIDLSLSMGLTPVDRENTISYIIICEYSNTTQGFLVSQPNVLLSIGWDHVKKLGGIIQDTGYLTALAYDKNDEAIQILDIEKILSEVIGLDEEISQDLIDKTRGSDFDEMRVLVLDDSKAARGMMKHALDQLGVSHLMFEEGDHAYQALVKSLQKDEIPIVLIISDIEMPGMDGFTFSRKVKANPDLKDIPLLLHSSMSNKANSSKAKSVGADGFVPKFQPDVIASLVMERLGIVEEQGGTRTKGAYFD
ncbi:MAG: chemotaxis protein CheV [Magnetococcales bacterium]|nr:chemotaxis protein CheV [Magnetococcales bacterium]